VADFKDFQLDARPEAQVYMACPLAPGMLNVRLFVRTDRPRGFEPLLARVASSIDPDVPARVNTLAEILAGSITSRRFNMYVLEIFAGSALLLALVGIYGVLAYVIKQRRREIGIRMALGAERARIMRLVVAYGMRIAGAGIRGSPVLFCKALLSSTFVPVYPARGKSSITILPGKSPGSLSH
jgi:hypothetical protein